MTASPEADDSEHEDDELVISEDIISSPTHKSAGDTIVDFDGMLHRPLVLHEDLKQGCGGQLWPAGMVLAKYLLRYQQLRSLRDKSMSAKLLELGAGSGLVGLALAVALTGPASTPSDHNSKTTIRVTDQAPMLPLMQQNIELNNLPESLISSSVLDWGVSMNENGPPDVILAADCVYFEPAFPLLQHTLTDLIGDHTICYFCFKKRRRADLRFMKNAKKSFSVEEIRDDPEKGQWSREGIFFYKITKKN